MSVADVLRKVPPRLYRLRLLLIIIAVLVLSFATYYFLYVRSQTGYFADRSLRKLSLIGSQIALKVESAGLVLKHTSEKFIRPQVVEPESPTFDTDPAHRQQNLEQIKEVFKRLKDDSPQIIPLNIDTEPWSDKVSPGTVTPIAVRLEADSPWLYLDYVSEGILEKTVVRVQAKTDLNRLIQPFLSARVGSNPDQFQNILIAEVETAKVIFQYDTTQVRVASLDKLPSSENGGKKIDLKEGAQTSNVVDVSLAGSNYRLFSHPLKLFLPVSSANSPNAAWTISGLVKSNYFQTEAWSLAVPYTILIICGFIIALLVFSWPFLKLVLTGPKDRFRTPDVYFLVFATVVILAVFTCFGLYGYVYLSVEAQMNGQVKGLAANIKKNFNEELKLALKQLDTLSKNRGLLERLDSEALRESGAKRDAAATLDSTGKTAPTELGESIFKSEAAEQDATHGDGLEADIYRLRETNRPDILAPVLMSSKTTYPYFDNAVWIDETGMQKAKWTIKSYTPQRISVFGRAYFDNIRRGRFYELDGYKFWLEPIISKTTGRSEVEISQAVPDTSWTTAFDTRLLSLMDPVLPAAFGFMIIGNDGKVLFHSDEAHHLGEDVFQECDEDRNLRSAVLGRGDRPLDVRYLGEDHHFFVTTLEGFPDWSLIVFRNKQPLRSAFFELLTSVTILFLAHCFVLMAGFTVLYLIYVRNSRKAWFWPSPRKKRIYFQSLFLLLVLVVISSVVTILVHGQRLVWLSAGIGLLSALVFFVSWQFGVRFRSPLLRYLPRIPGRFRRYDRLYVLNLTFLLLLVAILPAGAFFKYAYESEITLFIKHSQFSVATALAKRDERIRSQYSTIAFVPDGPSIQSPAQMRNAFVERRSNEPWDVYDKFFFKTGLESPDPARHICKPAPQPDFLSRLSTLLPLSNRTSVEMRGLLDNPTVGGVCQWELGAMDALTLRLDRNVGQTATRRLHLNTAVPLLGVPGFPWVAILVLFVPFFLLINFIVRRVFLLDAHKPSSHSLKNFLSNKTDRNVFVVVNAPFVKKIPGQASNLYLKDLPSIATSADWADTFDYTSCGDEAVIALDQFDYRMDDPQTNKQKLKLLERLLEKNRKLVIFSSAELSQYRFENGENGHANGNLDESGRWAGVIISNFFTEYAEDTDYRYGYDTKDGSSFKEKVQQEKARILANGRKGRTQKDIDELFGTLYFECARREPLQGVAMQILKQKGFVRLSREHLLGRITNQARAYYVHIWNSCSTGQKLTLCHLAQDRLLSHRDPDLECLLRRELIVRDEGLHLFNESFREFVRSKDILSFMSECDAKAKQGSLWQILKVPILIVMLAVATFLFVTQQDLYTSSLALVTGVTTLIPMVFKVMSLFHAEPVARPPTQG